MSDESKEPEKSESDGTGQKFLARIFGPPADEAGDHLALELRALLAPRRANLEAVIRKSKIPQAELIQALKTLPMKTWVPMLEAASLEEDETLQEKWAALLANATSGQVDFAQLPSLSNVLTQLSPHEVKILDWIYSKVLEIEKIPFGNGALRNHLVVGFPAVIYLQMHEMRNYPAQHYSPLFENLDRLGLCRDLSRAHQTSQEWEAIYRSEDWGLNPKLDAGLSVTITLFGLAFIQACQPSAPATPPE